MSTLKNKVNTETAYSKQSRKKTHMQHKITAFANIEINMYLTDSILSPTPYFAERL